jgi:UDP-N-acetyl-D-mannosaminuronic acid dehydrogenase
VPTPFKENKKADLSYVWSALESIANVLQKGNVVILESTIPVGTTNKAGSILEEKTGLIAGVDFYLAHCPERVLPGNIFHELVFNDRIIGGINLDSVNAAKEFYKKFVQGQLYLTNATTAEMIKLVENSSRDVAIAFANQVADMSYKAGLDPFEVIALANKHPRVNILNPSCGVGGHCIAVDPWFLIETFSEQTKLLKTARLINDEKPDAIIAMTKKSVEDWQTQNSGKPNVMALGLTYKPNVDDLRESPALAIANDLSKLKHINFYACEPNIHTINKKVSMNVVDLEDGLEKADIIVCLVAHEQFKKLKQQNYSHKKIIDACGLLYSPPSATEQEVLFWPAQSKEHAIESPKQRNPIKELF